MKLTEQQRIQFLVMLNSFEDKTAELKKMELLDSEESDDSRRIYWNASADLIKYKMSIVKFVEAL